MAQGDRRFWTVVNTILLLGVVVLLVALLVGRRHVARQAEAPAAWTPKPATPARPQPARREADAGRMGARPVAFTPCANVVDATEALRMRGIRPQDWGALPVSPGMDMAETAEGFLLAFSLPGVRDEDIRLTMTDRVVTVHAVIRDAHGNQVGGMERRVLLPRTPGTPLEFKSLFTNGILRVCVAK